MEIYKAFCLDVAQGHMKGAPNETRTKNNRHMNTHIFPCAHIQSFSGAIKIYI